CCCKHYNGCCKREDDNAILKCDKHVFSGIAKMGLSASCPSLEYCGLALGRNLHSSSSLFLLESHNDHCIYCSISRPLRELQYVRTPHSADDRSSRSVPLYWIVLSSLIRS